MAKKKVDERTQRLLAEDARVKATPEYKAAWEEAVAAAEAYDATQTEEAWVRLDAARAVLRKVSTVDINRET